MRKLFSVALAALVLAAAGCGNSGDKNKNKGKDVPREVKAEPTGT